MTDVDTGIGPFPTVVDLATGGHWAKAVTASAVAARWSLYGDSRLFYWCPSAYSQGSSATGQATYWCGDVIPYKSGDAFATSISASRATPDNNAWLGSVFYGGQAGTSSAVCRFPRSYTGLGSAVSAHASPLTGLPQGLSGGDSTLGVFPPPTDGVLRLSKIIVTEQTLMGSAATIPRGEMPGAYHCPQLELYKTFQRKDTVVAEGRRLSCVHVSQLFTHTPLDTISSGRGFIDISGPWR